MKNAPSVDINDLACDRYAEVQFGDVERELKLRTPLKEWLQSKGLLLKGHVFRALENVVISGTDIAEEALVRLVDTVGGDSNFVFRHDQIEASAAALCGTRRDFSQLNAVCGRLAQSSSLAKHASIATEAEFLATKSALTRRVMTCWNDIMTVAFHRYEHSTTFQYDVDPVRKTFGQDQTYSWDFLESVLVQAGAVA